MISSTYFKCQKDFNKIVPEELIGGEKNHPQFIELPEYTKGTNGNTHLREARQMS